MDDRNEKFSDQEATRRAEKALRAAFSTPHKTYEESKVGEEAGLRESEAPPCVTQKARESQLAHRGRLRHRS